VTVTEITDTAEPNFCLGRSIEHFTNH